MGEVGKELDMGIPHIGYFARVPGEASKAMFLAPGKMMNWARRPKTSTTGTRTRVARVRAEYPSQLDFCGIYIYNALVCKRAGRMRNKWGCILMVLGPKRKTLNASRGLAAETPLRS